MNGNYVGIDLLGRALQIAVESDAGAATDRWGSNGLPKAVNLDKLMKTITKLQELEPSAGALDCKPRAEGAANVVSSKQVWFAVASWV